MNRSLENGLPGTTVKKDPSELLTSTLPTDGNGSTPYVPQKEQVKGPLKDNGQVLVIGAGIVLVLLLLAFNGISRRSSPTKKSSAAAGEQAQTQSLNSSRAPASMTPILDTGRSPVPNSDSSRVNPEQIARTATKQPKPSPGTNLGSVRPFDKEQTWQPAPFQPGTQLTDMRAIPPSAQATENKEEREAMDKASLVFVRNGRSSASGPPSEAGDVVTDWGTGLAPGTKLRARLESAVNTAVRTPVVAVIEYNYEQNGELLVPAGAKAFGHLEAADRTGYIGIRFESLLMPDGSSVNLEAAATDLQLRPLRGKVEGKHTGKNILVQSFAGVGQIAATLMGRGSLNQPLSEGDLLRERVSNNIGQASDQTMANLGLTEHIVVSVPADTEIYVIPEKPASDKVPRSRTPMTPQTASQPSIEELRQLMRLERELDQTAPTQPPQ